MSEHKTSDLATAETRLILNAWYVAGTSDELGDALFDRWLLGRSILLYRTSDGRPVAMDNRCPHRSFPLSRGRRDGDHVACGYHGMTFGPDGRCTKIPALTKTPSNIRTRIYPVVEQSPLIWFWPGDPALADEALIPSHFPLDDAAWAAASGYYHVAANYVGLQENLQDLSHFEHLHSSSIGIPDQSVATTHVETGPDAIRSTRVYSDVPPPPMWKSILPLKGERITRTIAEAFHSPALCEAMTTITDEGQGDDGERDVHVRILHFITPAFQHETHYWWFFLRDFSTDDSRIGDSLAKGIAGAFAEDKEALESISALVRADARDSFQEVSFASDKAGVLIRRRLQQLADAETV